MAYNMSNDINEQALIAKRDMTARENFIRAHKKTILRVASVVSMKFVNDSDDEWSVALYAFSNAVDRYDSSAGDFLPFAKMLIKQALIDAYRSKTKFSPEEADDGTILNIVSDDRQEVSNNIREEIFAANEMLKEYGFRFMDLAEASPKQERTRKECARAVRVLLNDKASLDRLKISKQLDIKYMQVASGVSRKVLENYRRYIIMASLILSDDYPYISEYLKYIKEEQ